MWSARERDTPLLITLKPSHKDLEVDGIEINGSGTGLEARIDESTPWNPQQEAPTYLVHDNSSQDGLFVPGNVGSYVLRINVKRKVVVLPAPEPFYPRTRSEGELEALIEQGPGPPGSWPPWRRSTAAGAERPNSSGSRSRTWTSTSEAVGQVVGFPAALQAQNAPGLGCLILDGEL